MSKRKYQAIEVQMGSSFDDQPSEEQMKTGPKKKRNQQHDEYEYEFSRDDDMDSEVSDEPEDMQQFGRGPKRGRGRPKGPQKPRGIGKPRGRPKQNGLMAKKTESNKHFQHNSNSMESQEDEDNSNFDNEDIENNESEEQKRMSENMSNMEDMEDRVFVDEDSEEEEDEISKSRMPKNASFFEAAQDQMFESQQEAKVQNHSRPILKREYDLKDYIPPAGISPQNIPIMQSQQTVEKQPTIEIDLPGSEQKRNAIINYAKKYPEYKQRRFMKYIDGKLDLNVRYLHQLVYDLYLEGLICHQLMLSIQYMGLPNSLEFIQKYKQNKLAEFNFQKVKFTIFDIPRIIDLLMTKGKRKYTVQKQRMYIPYQYHLFMNEVYGMVEQNLYQPFCNTLDSLYDLYWWKTIGTSLQGRRPPEENNNVQIPKRRRNPPRKSDNQKEGEEQRRNNVKLQNDRIKLQHESDMQEENQSVNPVSKQDRVQQSSNLFSSAIFQSEKMIDNHSQFSIGQSVSISSSLESMLDKNSDENKKMNRKEELIERQQIKLTKDSQNLKKIESKLRNPKKQVEKVEKEQPKPTKKSTKNNKKVSKKDRKKQTKARVYNDEYEKSDNQSLKSSI